MEAKQKREHLREAEVHAPTFRKEKSNKLCIPEVNINLY